MFPGKGHTLAEQPRPWHVRLVPRPLRSLYRRLVPRPLRVFVRERSGRFWALLAVYVALQWLFITLHFGLAFFGVALCAFFFLSLSASNKRRPGELSAYSVFNPALERLPGTLDAAEYERMLRRGGM